MTTLPAIAPPAALLTFPALHRPLIAAAVLCLAFIGPTALALAIDTRVLDDEALWLKPLKFQISLALLALTTAILPLAFPPAYRTSRWLRWPAFVTAAAIIYEVIFLALQAARGVRSHFNDDTAFDAIGGAIMTAGAGILVAGPAVIGGYLTIRALRNGHLTPLRLAVGLGLVAGGILATWTGSALGANNGPFIGAYDPADPVLPLFGWSRTIGDLRVGHFLGLHLMQALPALALLTQGMPRARAYAVVLTGAALWTGLTIAAQFTALAGQPILPLP